MRGARLWSGALLRGAAFVSSERLLLLLYCCVDLGGCEAEIADRLRRGAAAAVPSQEAIFDPQEASGSGPDLS